MRISTGFLFLLLFLGGCRDGRYGAQHFAPFLRQEAPQVEAWLQAMSVEEKVGQLLVLRSGPRDSVAIDDLYRLVGEGKIGGFVLSGLPLSRYLNVVDSARHMAWIAPFVGTEEEVVLNNQFSDVPALPTAATLAAVTSDTLRGQLRRFVFEQVRALGINLWMGPPLVVNQGEEEQQRWLSETSQFNDLGVLSLAGPIPALPAGLPDSLMAVDPNLALYRQFVQGGIAGLRVEASLLDDILPDPLPEEYLREYLRFRLGFEGLIVASTPAGPALDRALRAGVDLLVVDGDPDGAFHQVLARVQSGALSTAALDERVRKILQAKFWMRLGTSKPGERRLTPPAIQASVASVGATAAASPERTNLLEHFNSEGWTLVRRRLFEDALTVASNPYQLLPFGNLADRRFHLLEYSQEPFSYFETYFSKYADFQASQILPTLTGAIPDPGGWLGDDETGILLLDEYRLDGRRDSVAIDAIRRLGAEQRLVLVNFREPANLRFFDSTLTVVQVYERVAFNEELTAQLLFGAVPAKGRFPLDINASFRRGQGSMTPRVRLQYATPEAAGIAPQRLVGIDAIANTAIDDKAIPGCQILVAKDGKVIYDKTFGKHTYKGEEAVQATDLYDLASVTKIAATTLAVMQLYDRKEIDLNDRLRDVLPLDDGATIRNISLEKLLIHESGLQPNLPIVPYLLTRGKRNANCRGYFCKYGNGIYTIPVADHFYFDRRQREVIWKKIERLPVGNQRKYRYSDVNFVLLQRVVEAKTQLPLDQHLQEAFYRPLGLRHTTFRPLDRFDGARIVPTQDDRRWRNQLLTGYVHDEAAALMGGVAGNAGLFSTAEDLAVLSQLWLNGGVYGGQRFFQPETVELFTRDGHGNHRGLGFDKPYRTNTSALAPSASPATYGHTGFTGTCLWVDPEKNLVFVFLSNRVHPNARNTLLFRNNVRRRIHQVIYEALDSFSEITIPELEG